RHARGADPLDFRRNHGQDRSGRTASASRRRATERLHGLGTPAQRPLRPGAPAAAHTAWHARNREHRRRAQNHRRIGVRAPVPTGARLIVRVIYQNEVADCGYACLAMVLCHLGRATEVREIAALRPISSHGLTLMDLYDVAIEFGLAVQAYRFDAEDLGEIKP